MPQWVREDANFDSNPKAIAAGWWGARAAETVWRIAKQHGRAGVLKPGFVTGIYLAQFTHAPQGADVSYQDGIESAIREGLLERLGDGRIRVHDWPDYQWDDTAAERQRRFRENHSGKPETVTESNGPSRSVTAVTATIRDDTRLDDTGPARAREGSSTRMARIARWHTDAMRTKGPCKSIVEDLAGAAVCESILASLSDSDCETVVRAFVADPDPFLVKQGHALRWLDAARANRYLTPGTSADKWASTELGERW